MLNQKVNFLPEVDVLSLKPLFQILNLLEPFFQLQPVLLALQGIYKDFPQQAQPRDEFLRPDPLTLSRTDVNNINGLADQDGNVQIGSNTHLMHDCLSALASAGRSSSLETDITSCFSDSFSYAHG